MNESELIEALHEAIEQARVEGAENTDDDFTRADFEVWMDVSHSIAARMLRKLAKAGTVERVWVRRKDGWGTTRTSQGYRMATKEPAG